MHCFKLEYISIVHELVINLVVIDILGLAEVRSTGFEETTMDEGHKIRFRKSQKKEKTRNTSMTLCGEDVKYQYEVAFVVRKQVVGSITSCTPISRRFISIRISARPHTITVIHLCTNFRPRRRGGRTVLCAA